MDFEVVVKFYDDEMPHHGYYNTFEEARQVFRDCIDDGYVKSVVVVSYLKSNPVVVLAYSEEYDDYDINFPLWVDD